MNVRSAPERLKICKQCFILRFIVSLTALANSSSHYQTIYVLQLLRSYLPLRTAPQLSLVRHGMTLQEIRPTLPETRGFEVDRSLTYVLATYDVSVLDTEFWCSLSSRPILVFQSRMPLVTSSNWCSSLSYCALSPFNAVRRTINGWLRNPVGRKT